VEGLAVGVGVRTVIVVAAGAGAAETGRVLAEKTDGKARDKVRRGRYKPTQNALAWGRYYRGVGRYFWRKYGSLRGVGARMRQKLGDPRFRNRFPKMVSGCVVGAIAGAMSGLPDTDAGRAAKKAKEGCVGGLVTKALLP
jgi:hypothetical protein